MYEILLLHAKKELQYYTTVLYYLSCRLCFKKIVTRFLNRPLIYEHPVKELLTKHTSSTRAFAHFHS
jgi:hypothetical protein